MWEQKVLGCKVMEHKMCINKIIRLKIYICYIISLLINGDDVII